MSAIAIGRNSTGAWRSTQPGVSEAAQKIQEVVRGVLEGFVSSATGQRRLGDPFGALEAIYEDCAAPNWDSEGALPVSAAALEEAINLLLTLPTTVPVPEPLAERSGRIAFEWYKRPDCIYVLSTGGTKELEFAALLGLGYEIHGKCPFSDALPSIVLDHLKEFQQS
jgi:hypothetical protein